MTFDLQISFFLYFKKVFVHNRFDCLLDGASLVAQQKRTQLPMQETRVGSLDQEDTAKKEITTHSNSFALRIPRTEEPGGLQSMGLQKVWKRLSH